jgi:hypothetical protein
VMENALAHLLLKSFEIRRITDGNQRSSSPAD